MEELASVTEKGRRREKERERETRNGIKKESERRMVRRGAECARENFGFCEKTYWEKKGVGKMLRGMG